MTAPAPAPRAAAVAGAVSEELPHLRVWTSEVPGRDGRSPAEVRERLRLLADRLGGARAITLRTEPIAHAYRVLFRHLGIDPDVDRVPLEAVVVDRLFRGGFRSAGLVGDALTIGLVETGVPLVALDAARVEGEVVLRPSGPGEALGSGDGAVPLAPGRLVVADPAGPLLVLFGDVAARVAVDRRTERLLLLAVQAPGVPAIHVEEALWTAAEVLATPSPG